MKDDAAKEICVYTVVGMHHAHAHGIIADQTAVLWVGVLTEKCVDL
jgi:hypothetical protein